MSAHQHRSSLMTIGTVARQLGITPRTLRFYERIGLLIPTGRTEAGYRLYTERDAERAAFIRCAQTFALSLDDIASILAMRDSGVAPCREVRALAEAHLRALDARLAELLALRAEVARLAAAAAQVEPACRASAGICLAFDTP